MKTTLLLLISFFSIGALACPSLTGNYNCTENNGITYEETILQLVTDEGVTVYRFDDETIITDGVVRSEPIEGGGTSTYSASCEGTFLKYNSSATVPALGLIAKGEGTITPTNIGYVINGKIEISFGGAVETDVINTVCVKSL